MEKNTKDLKEKLLSNEEQKVAKGEKLNNSDLKTMAGDKTQDAAADKAKAKAADSQPKPRGIPFAAKFIVSALWRGGGWIKFQVILTSFLIILAKVLNVFHPIVLKVLIDTLIKGDSIYHLVAFYA